MFADFYGVNIPTMVKFKLPTWRHLTEQELERDAHSDPALAHLWNEVTHIIETS